MNWLCIVAFVTFAVGPCGDAQQACPWTGQWVDVPGSDPHVERRYISKALPCTEFEIEDRNVTDCPPWSEWTEWEDIPGDPNAMRIRSRSRGLPCTGIQIQFFQPACPQNILIAVETSSRCASRRRFVQLKDGLKVMLLHADIQPSGTHVGICYFGTTAEAIITLVPFHTHADVNAIITASQPMLGRRMVSLGCQCLHSEWLSSTRPGTHTVCVLVICGNPGDDDVALQNITFACFANLKNTACDESVIISIGSLRNTFTGIGSYNYFHAQSFADFRGLFETENAFPMQCPVDGQWSAYGDWSDCSATCGGGRRFRVRTCTNPMPTEGGSDCDSADGDSEDEECNLNPCPRDGEWSEWDNWGTCTVTCGGGTRRRTRECDNPTPIFGGAECPENSDDSESCNVQECPSDGEWSPWHTWSACSLSCGGGTRNRSRECNTPPPTFGGAECPGSSDNFESCNVQQCPGDGNWGSWDPWGACSHTCGNGTRERSRGCNDPPPTSGGDDCVGRPDDTGTCNVQPCSNCPLDVLIAVDTSQSVSRRRFTQLKAGITSMLRNVAISEEGAHVSICYFGTTAEAIVTLVPFHGKAQIDRIIGPSRTLSGRTMVSLGIECMIAERRTSSRPFVPGVCVLIIDGNPSNPPNDSAELAATEALIEVLPNGTCGVFMVFAIGNAFVDLARIRSWVDPAHVDTRFLHAQTFATFSNFFLTVNAFEIMCPVDGEWSPWGAWSVCSATCGGGRRTRARTCTGGDADCVGGGLDEKSCNVVPCPVSVPCPMRIRAGTNNRVFYNTLAESAEDMCCRVETQIFDEARCTCVNVTDDVPCPMRIRAGTDNRVFYNTLDEGAEDMRCCAEPQIFDEARCTCVHVTDNGDGNWGSWDPWGACSRTCDGGTRRRTRECNDPPPTFGGDDCPGSPDNSGTCNVRPCP